jgi:hypothetical protein
MMIYIVRYLPDGDSYAEYDGMTQDGIRDMLGKQSVDFDFVTEDEYNAFIAANTPIIPLLGN